MSEYRTFRLFKYSPPEKTAANYSEAEKEQFQKSFQPVARDYRILKVSFYVLLVGAVGFMLISKQHWDGYLFFGFFGIYVLLYYFLFKPVCPACKRNADVTVRTFCPLCGSNKINFGGFMRSTECLSCGEILRQGKGGRRLYKVRYCTHCGIFLDAQGI
jgi:ribosomal protein S27E